MISNFKIKSILLSIIIFAFCFEATPLFSTKSENKITPNTAKYFVNVDNNGKNNKLELEYINNSRYIDVEKIPNNIINNAKYNSSEYSVTSDNIKLQFLPGSFYYTLDNIEETKIIQMYMPTITKNVTKGKDLKLKLFIPFVSFMKSLDSAGLYDVSYENNKNGDIVRIVSKNTKNTFTIAFPKLNFIDTELSNELATNSESIDETFMSLDEDYWDEERIANMYAEGNDLEDDLSNNEFAESISEVANKVYNSIQTLDKKNFASNEIASNGASIGGSGGKRITNIMPRYRGPFIRRKSYTDPFPNMNFTTENDNLKIKVMGSDKKETTPKKVKTKPKVSKDETEFSNTTEDKPELKTEKQSEIKQSKATNSDYYLPQNLKRPGIDF